MVKRVMIVDDSPTARLALRQLVASDDRFEIVGEAATSQEARRLAAALVPDLLTMDITLRPGDLDGVEATGAIMREGPVPIVIVTAADPGDQDLVYRAMAAGALEILPKPPDPNSKAYPAARAKMLRVFHALAGVPVVTHRGRHQAEVRKVAETPGRLPEPPTVVGIGASTGGPPVVRQLLADLAPPYPLPIVIVQHIALGFGAGFCRWLQETTGHEVIHCREEHRLEAGRVYVAPEDEHLILRPGRVLPRKGPLRGHLSSSIDVTFESLAQVVGASAVALLLTGMGSDGADGMVAIREAGGRTFVQAPETCIVAAMPEEALRARAVLETRTPEGLGALLQELARELRPEEAGPKPGREEGRRE